MPKKLVRPSLEQQARQDLKERESLPTDSRNLRERLDQQTNQSPALSGGDVDAAWDRADMSGEETVGGSVATPDQDRVDAIGTAAGLTYQDDEPLNFEGKMRQRDEERWELNPASATAVQDADGKRAPGWDDLADEPTLTIEEEEEEEEVDEEEEETDEEDEDTEDTVGSKNTIDAEDDDEAEDEEDDEEEDDDDDDDDDDDELDDRLERGHEGQA